jgi:hypothetical protein
MALGNYTSGSGTITVSAGTTTVTGSGTSFHSQLKPGTVIGNITNNFAGYVSSVTSDTSATLFSASAINIIANSFTYRPVTSNTVTYTYYTSGNITANIYSQVVTGIGTHFASELSYGDTLYISNLAVANASGPNIAVGVVELITSNTSLYLRSLAFANVANLQFWNSPSTFTSDSVYAGAGSQSSNPNSLTALSVIHAPLYNWTYSGLIPNVAVVNNYHPPMIDSVTGVLVNLPASIYKKISNGVSNTYTLGTSLSYDGSDYIVQDFDVNQHVFGTDSSYVIGSLHNSFEIQNAALNGTQDAYDKTVKNLIQPTAADHAASFFGANIARVTDNHDLAVSYFSKSSPLQNLRSNPANFTANQNASLRKEAKGLRKLVATGAPIAIPGLLNIIADTYVPGNIAWTPPKFSPSVVNYVANTNAS